MKKHVAILLGLFLVLGMAVAQTEPAAPAQPAAPTQAAAPAVKPAPAANFLGYNFTSMIFSALGGVLDFPFCYQHSFGKFGIDVGFEYATNALLATSSYGIQTSAIAVSAGPAWFPMGKGVSGLFVRARGSLVFATATYKGTSVTGTGFGADAHVGYNVVIPSMVPGSATVITPFAGFQTNPTTTGFSWGVNLGMAF